MDIFLFKNSVAELSVTEVLQEILLFFSAFCFAYSAYFSDQEKGFFILVCGFFISILVREMDFLLDDILFESWKIPVAIVVLVCALYAGVYCKISILNPMIMFSSSKSYDFILIGFLITMIFSRVFGSGNLLWEDLMQIDYRHLYKTTIQEALELLGYVLIGYGSCLQMMRIRKNIEEADLVFFIKQHFS